jgi:hypothetical protein
MKIAYYIYWLDDIESGVIKKINDQINYWVQQGNDVKLFVLTKQGSSLERSLLNRKKKINYEIEIVPFSNKIKYVSKGFTINGKIKKYNPDIIYMRESKITPGIFKLIKDNKTILELNSITKEEEVNSFNLGNIYNKFSNYYKFKYVDGFVAVTSEIGKHDSIKKYNKPTEIIGNGIDLLSNKPLDNNSDKTQVNLVFIGSDNQKWHGINKIIELSKIKKKWNFHIIGISNNLDKLDNVKFYGMLSKEEYLKIFSQMDVAIGTLALYRIKLYEACPLKTREYLARGLPIIIGYDDVDFPNEYDFLCKIENNKNNIKKNINKIEDFVQKWKNKRIDNTKISHLDVSFKEKKRLTFFEEILYNEKYKNIIRD